MIEILLLSVIALELGTILVFEHQTSLFSFRKLKRMHYKKSKYSVQRNLWDIEFKRDACEAAREAERMLYDRLSEQVAAFNVRIEKLKERNAPEDAKDIEDSNVKVQELLDARKMHENQIDELDGQQKNLSKNIDDLKSIMGLIEDKIKKS